MIVPSKLRFVTLIAFLLKIFNTNVSYLKFFKFIFVFHFFVKYKTEAKILLFLATNDLVHFHYDVLNTILNGDKEDDMDEQGDLQFGHLLNQSVKLLRLQGDMTHQVCLFLWKNDFVEIIKFCFLRNEQVFLVNFLN